MKITAIKPDYDHLSDTVTQLSAAMDGELDDTALTACLRQYKQDESMHRQWEAYHVVGDVLRQTPFISSNLAAKINRQLTDEPTVLAPKRYHAITKYAMPMAASIAAVMLVSWSALNLPNAATGTTQPPLAVAQLQQDKIDQVELADFISAHRDYSPGATSPFVNASYQVAAEHSR